MELKSLLAQLDGLPEAGNKMQGLDQLLLADLQELVGLKNPGCPNQCHQK